MSNLDTKSKYVNIVCMNDFFHYKNLINIENYCRQYFLHYAFIVHDKDKNIINGILEDKKIHLHLVGILKQSKRFSTILNQFRDYFELDNLNAVNIEKCLSLEGSIQYLIHKNDSDKYQYQVKDIHHNFGNDLQTYLDMSSIELTYDKLKSIIIHADSILDVIYMLGLPRYNCYRHVVKDMWEVLKLNNPLKNMVNEYERKKETRS